MRPSKAYVVLAALVAAGCASNPEVATDAVPTAAPPLAAAAAAAASPAAGGSATVVPDTVIDANELIANTPPPPVCREMLRPNSNVRTKTCMSAEHWRLYDRAEAQRAGELLRTWQSGTLR